MSVVDDRSTNSVVDSGVTSSAVASCSAQTADRSSPASDNAAEGQRGGGLIIVDEGPIPTFDEPRAVDGQAAAPMFSDDERADAPAAGRPPPQVTGALGRLWESWHLAMDSEWLSFVQQVELRDGPWRMLGSAWIESKLLPAPNLSVTANGFARIAIDGTPNVTTAPVLDVYEAFAKLNVGRTTVQLGRLVVPWGRTAVAALGDRLHASDVRRGAPFPDGARQRQPLWGATARTSLGSVVLEGVAFADYAPPEGSLAASNQGGARLVRYQGALVRSPARAGGLLNADDTSSLRAPMAPFTSGSLGARASRRLGDFDVGASVVWGFDDIPHLHLRPDVARALAGEYLSFRGVVLESEPVACDVPFGLACIGGNRTLVHERTTSFAADASWGLGVVILRAEVLVHPDFGGLGGKTVVLVDDYGLRSTRTTHIAAALAVDGSIGDLLDGSLELFNVSWMDIPADGLVWGVEPFTSSHGRVRDVQRVGAAASLSGSLMNERVTWKVRGEAGINAMDALVSLQVRYQLPLLGLYTGGRADAFAGVPGTPGWFRQDATLVGVFLGEGS